MAVTLRLAIILITLACVAMFLFSPWWFPAAASAYAPLLDSRFRVALWILGGLFVLAQLVLFLVLGRQRREGNSSWYGNWKLELAWTLAIAAIFFWFNVSGESLWSRMTSHTAAGNAIQVEVTGVQFQWYFRYPGPDGVLGRVDAVKFARPDEGNPLGIDPDDPAGKDDVVSPTLVLPVSREATLILRAQDVIHSVFIPAMRFKQDAVPGMDFHAQFTPTQIGSYELTCTQLCGLGHYRMRAVVRVVSDGDFKQWLKDRPNARSAADSH
jgi:cytochrome c oxidase subunit II